MPYVAVSTPVIFCQLEKALVESQIDIAEQEKTEMYGKIPVIRGHPQASGSIYVKLNEKIDKLKQNLVSICRVTGNNALYDTVFDNYPQAVVGVSFCLASLEYSRIQVWLTSSLANIFGAIPWSVAAVFIASITMIGLVTTIMTSRYVINVFIFSIFSM